MLQPFFRDALPLPRPGSADFCFFFAAAAAGAVGLWLQAAGIRPPAAAAAVWWL